MFKILDKKIAGPDPRFYNRCLGRITRGKVRLKKKLPDRPSINDLSVSLELVNLDQKSTVQRCSITEQKHENDYSASYTEIKQSSKGSSLDCRMFPTSKYNTQKNPSEVKANKEKQDKSQICIICYDKISNSVLLPCCHGGLCYECAIQLSKQKAVCHFCRKV